jgi:Spy/CpxP family protein refolding chaperone
MTAVVVGSLLVSGLAVAGNMWGHRGDHMQQMMNWKVDEALNAIHATDAQRKTAYALRDDLFEEGKKMHQTREEVHAELMQEWKSDKPDAQRVHADVDTMIDSIRAFAHKVADAGLRMHDVLTPAQRDELASHAEEHQHHGRWAH